MLLGAVPWIALAGCGNGGSATPDAEVAVIDAAVVDAQVVIDAAPPDAAPDADLRMTLESTGLYSDFANQVIAADVQIYTPVYPLWTDGEVKKRWVQFPEGSVIDTSNMDFWVYPVGTKMWKQFATPEGKILETRYMVKNGPDLADWYFVAFAWNEEQSAAFELPFGDIDVLGTSFDIPGQGDCSKCHERQSDFVIGFSAIQLAHTGPGVNLDTLIADGRLSDPPAGVSPYFVVPGDSNTQEVLGYIHGNCGGCHHPDSDVNDITPMHLRLEVATMATVEETSIFTTTVGITPERTGPEGTTTLIAPGDLEASSVYRRMNLRDIVLQMPPRGTEVVDTEGVDKLATWILSLPPL